MKNKCFFAGFINVLLIIGFILVGCGDNDTPNNGGNSSNNGALSGTYSGNNYGDFFSFTFSGSNYTFKIDGFEYERGSYTITGNSVRFIPTWNEDNDIFPYNGILSNNNNTITFSIYNVSYIITKETNNSGGNNSGNGGQPSSNVYLGVAAFNDTVKISDISNNLGTAKTFIDNSTNSVDATALCYAVSKAITMFSKSGLPVFDHTFIVTFTDGVDNRSSSLYVADGKSVTQAQVYNQAKTDLATKPGLKSYAIGFTGNEAINSTQMQNLVQNGQYKTASDVSELNGVFKNIADSVLASSKNVTLKTNAGLLTETEPKYFRLTVTAVSDLNSSYPTTYTETIRGKLVYNMGQTGAVPVFTVTQAGTYTTFDNPINGTENSGKILLPIKNLKYTRSGTDYFIKSIKVEVSYDGNTYREDTEDGSTEEDISKTIGVVLVIDCSQSLGAAFSSVKSAAKNFIDTLAAR